MILIYLLGILLDGKKKKGEKRIAGAT